MPFLNIVAMIGILLVIGICVVTGFAMRCVRVAGSLAMSLLQLAGRGVKWAWRRRGLGLLWAIIAGLTLGLVMLVRYLSHRPHASHGLSVPEPVKLMLLWAFIFAAVALVVVLLVGLWRKVAAARQPAAVAPPATPAAPVTPAVPVQQQGTWIGAVQGAIFLFWIATILGYLYGLASNSHPSLKVPSIATFILVLAYIPEFFRKECWTKQNAFGFLGAVVFVAVLCYAGNWLWSLTTVDWTKVNFMVPYDWILNPTDHYSKLITGVVMIGLAIVVIAIWPKRT